MRTSIGIIGTGWVGSSVAMERARLHASAEVLRQATASL